MGLAWSSRASWLWCLASPVSCTCGRGSKPWHRRDQFAVRVSSSLSPISGFSAWARGRGQAVVPAQLLATTETSLKRALTVSVCLVSCSRYRSAQQKKKSAYRPIPQIEQRYRTDSRYTTGSLGLGGGSRLT